ncbi:hypothetical protein PUN28_014217 [Cardiocondyla obscurior]|uniref:Uncharacterized protein n=1 Tax=Cardiocondyla obscurior TaxID=286306 RepID=A0AAW2F2X2_9HYME
MQAKFFIPEFSREKKKVTKRMTDEREPSKDRKLNDFRLNRNNRYVRQYFIEDEIALAKDIFWAEKQRMYNEANKKAIILTKKKCTQKKRLMQIE